jgi:hypothetical protein
MGLLTSRLMEAQRAISTKVMGKGKTISKKVVIEFLQGKEAIEVLSRTPEEE